MSIIKVESKPQYSKWSKLQRLLVFPSTILDIKWRFKTNRKISKPFVHLVGRKQGIPPVHSSSWQIDCLSDNLWQREMLSLSSSLHHDLLPVHEKNNFQEKGTFHSWGHLMQVCPHGEDSMSHLEDLCITLFQMRVCENNYPVFNTLKGRRDLTHLVILLLWFCISLATWWCDSVISSSRKLCFLLKLHDPLNSNRTN